MKPVACNWQRPALWLAAALLVIGYAAGIADGYALRLLTIAGAYVVLVLGYQFVFGHAGALSLAQGAFFGLGAYITALLGLKAGIGYLPSLAIAIVATTAIAAFIAAPVLRLETHYFALATLGISQVLLVGVRNWESLTGGSNGLPGVPGIELFGLAVPRGMGEAVTVWTIAALAALLAWRIIRGARGRRFVVARTDLLAAGAAGIDANRLRFAAFVLSAAYGALAGGLYVPVVRVISPEVVTFQVMVVCLAMTVVGGRTSIAGAFIGAVLLIHLPEWFRFLEGYDLIAYGVILLLAIVAAPEGIAGLVSRYARRGAREDGLVARHGSPPPTEAPVAPDPARPAEPLRADRVSKSFGGIIALDEVSLSVEPGEIVGLIGANGAGKTTLANIVTGHYRPDAGRITLAGDDLTGLPPWRIARRGVGRTFQTPALALTLTARDNVAVALPPDAPAGGDADRCLDRAGIAGHADTVCAALPHGVRRRVELARALALAPSFILLDEPAAGLTAEEAASLSDTLKTLAAEGVGILAIEHDMLFLLSLAERVVCLDEGRVIADGPTEEVRADGAVTEAYLGITTAGAGQ